MFHDSHRAQSLLSEDDSTACNSASEGEPAVIRTCKSSWQNPEEAETEILLILDELALNPQNRWGQEGNDAIWMSG